MNILNAKIYNIIKLNPQKYTNHITDSFQISKNKN